MRIVILFLLVLNISCSVNKEKRKPQELFSEQRINKDHFLLAFQVETNNETPIDTNEIVYYYRKSFDTSCLIKLKNDSKAIQGIYFEILPKFHTDVEFHSIQGAKFIFFQGFNFSIPHSQLDSLTIFSKAIFKINTLVQPKTCFDCPTYFLRTNGKDIYDNQSNLTLFSNLHRYLRINLINNINSNRERFK